MNTSDNIKTIMSTKLITLHPKDMVNRAREIFNTYHIHHIPVVVMDKVVGILSQGDILFLEGIINNGFDKFVRDQKIASTYVEDVMTKKVACVDVSSSIKDVIKILVEYKINSVPVLEKNELIGMVTTNDILNALVEN